MTAIALNLDLDAITPAWESFQQKLPTKISVIRTEDQYDAAVQMMDQLLNEIGDNEQHKLIDMLDVLTQLIEDYETKHHAIPDAEPKEVLRFLMEQHGLKQADLAEELGGQPVVSAILNGDREINVRQAKELAKRFGVSAGVFI